ncbi:MAG TPA: PrgI family protein [Alphaproteobacteria bacterium]|jgi:hypothetical protein|nr:PrgI family protein [Alphaproteobacteria bacterium]
MEQHPIPQQISSYQFRLVGDMTLKQFFQLAGGFLVGLIFYSLPILGIIKWPFAIFSVILGAALAFVPLEERPLERWIFAFFKAVYSPTEYFWKKNAVTQKFFQDETVAEENSPLPLPQTSPLAKFELAEKGFLNNLMGIFKGNTSQPVNSQQSTVNSSQFTVHGSPAAIPIPQSVPVKIANQIPNTPQILVEEKPVEVATTNQITTQAVAPLLAGDEIISTKQAMFSVDAAPPNPPNVPNVVVGQVVDQDRKIIEGAIMEIRDSAGRPIRALRSNKAGHFITITPLESGRYDVITDKEGYEFTPVNFEATGQLIPPILVSGKKITI